MKTAVALAAVAAAFAGVVAAGRDLAADDRAAAFRAHDHPAAVEADGGGPDDAVGVDHRPQQAVDGARGVRAALGVDGPAPDSMLGSMATLPLPDGPPAPEGRTNREVVESHTEADGTTCQGCHKFTINPFGFVYENFDAIGSYRTEDRGNQVNAAAAPSLGSEATPVADGLELADVMAAREDIHACYVNHMVQFLRARVENRQIDYGINGRIGRRSQAENLSLKDVVKSIVTSKTFTHRSGEEL